ncbi:MULTISPECIES: MBL fold metallo-hydrolase [unclassified Paenibacillus]|uniref:MBL fold metallo-hydrolase n=1 Tax=unclassified Paenibacillus TaxID=185978 RepID=UPI001C1112C7|nr:MULTISPECIES: MBL fold metallo-hydrolase [unclassified Paenibacillus]MBU5442927.1 MBL fold metallo-hydrolase [Paenibacillus sp. MSJ-34]CAH0119526.1 Hydroxyacylglutathione hydrolase [Paenibacillus sp. CECT 9249]
MFTIEKSGEILHVNGIFMAKCTISVPGTSITVYSFNIDGVLIDTGARSLHEQFQPFFEQADFDQIMLTHFHEDHTGNAASLQQYREIPTFIHRMSTHLTERSARLPMYRQAFWGQPEVFTSQPLGQSFVSRNDTWEVIETPGHTKDHMSFYNRDRGAIFTGDLFVTPKVKVVHIDENIVSTLDSLKKVLTYDFEHMYCCHAGYVKDAKKWIQLKVDYLEEIEGKILAFSKQGKEINEITAELFPTPYPIIAASNTEWSPVHIVRNFLNRG